MVIIGRRLVVIIGWGLLREMLFQHGLSVHLSHLCTLLKAIGHNEMPFNRDTHVVPSNTVLDRGPGLPMKREIWEVGIPQFALMLAIAKLLWPML